MRGRIGIQRFVNAWREFNDCAFQRTYGIDPSRSSQGEAEDADGEFIHESARGFEDGHPGSKVSKGTRGAAWEGKENESTCTKLIRGNGEGIGNDGSKFNGGDEWMDDAWEPGLEREKKWSFFLLIPHHHIKFSSQHN